MMTVDQLVKDTLIVSIRGYYRDNNPDLCYNFLYGRDDRVSFNCIRFDDGEVFLNVQSSYMMKSGLESLIANDEVLNVSAMNDFEKLVMLTDNQRKLLASGYIKLFDDEQRKIIDNEYSITVEFKK